MTIRTGVALLLLILALSLCLSNALAAEEDAPAKKKPAKAMLTLKAKSIMFDRRKGDLKLEKEVHVTRLIGDQVLELFCDKMTAKMKDGKMQIVHATGNVKLLTPEVRASAPRADLDFTKNVITLLGTKDKPATMTTLTPPEITSTGPTIIFYADDERIEMPDGGDTTVPLELGDREKKKGKE